MYYKIYKSINNINGKIYIGYTHKSLEKRITEHRCNSKKGSSYLFHKAIRKYGEDNFSWEVILESKDKEYILKEMEKFFIKEYNSYFETGQGYNMTYGGQGGMTDKKHSELTKQKMKISRNKRLFEPMLGKKHSVEAKDKMRLAKIGKQRDLEFSKSCSERNKNRYLDPENRKILSEAIKISWIKRKQKQILGV